MESSSPSDALAGDQQDLSGRRLFANDPDSVLAIHQVLNLYHHIVDGRQWDLLDQVFAEDAEFQPPSSEVVKGREMIARYLGGRLAIGATRRPVAHHLTNVVITSLSKNAATVRSKYLAFMSDRSLVSGQYHDELRVLNGEWLLAAKRAVRTASVEPQ